MSWATRLFAVVLCIAASAVTDAQAIVRKGICDNGPNRLVALDAAQLMEQVAALQSIGVKWVRIDFDWAEIEPSPNKYVTVGYDAAVKALIDAGIDVLGVIAYSPSWANGRASSKYYPPVDISDYARFSRYLSERYASMGVHAWEIWNEPNTGQFWRPAPDPRAYTYLLRAAYEAIHAADPKASVITGGLAQPRNSPTSISALDFLRALYANGAQGFFDAVGDHPYSSPRKPSDAHPSNNWQKMFATSPNLRSLMTANGDANKQIWITEYGAPTSGIDPYSQKIVVSEADQAEILKQAYQLASTYPWSGPLFWYEYRDLCLLKEGESSQCYYGIVRFDGQPKPARNEYRSVPQ